MEWIKDEKYTNVWYTTKKFNCYQYNVLVIPYQTDTTINIGYMLLQVKNVKNLKNTTAYLCVGWADSRRRNIYQRLEKEGFQFMIDDNRKILMKKL